VRLVTPPDLEGIRGVLSRATGNGWEAAYRQDVGALLAEVERLREDVRLAAGELRRERDAARAEVALYERDRAGVGAAPLDLGSEPAFLFAVSTVGRVTQLGCGWDEEQPDASPAVVIVPVAWWREHGCWCDASDEFPELPDGFHSILSGAWEFWGAAGEAVRLLTALGFEQRPEIIDGAVAIEPGPTPG
jgi:hypothetical protein